MVLIGDHQLRLGRAANAEQLLVTLGRVRLDRFALLVRGMPRLVPARDVRLKEEGETPEEGTPQPVVLAIYDVGGVDVLAVDFWSLMDSIAPPAAFRLSGISGR